MVFQASLLVWFQSDLAESLGSTVNFAQSYFQVWELHHMRYQGCYEKVYQHGSRCRAQAQKLLLGPSPNWRSFFV
jgi:hypothetical protein